MDYLYVQADGLQWTLSSPTSCASPIEFAVGSSQWSLEPISDPPAYLASASTDSQASLVAGPQWTFQHVDSTFRNTILSNTNRLSESGATPFPISRKPSLTSNKQRPQIVIDSPVFNTEIRGAPSSAMHALPLREKAHGMDSPMLDLFHTLAPLSPALSANQLKLISNRAWSPITTGLNSQLYQPPPSAISGSSTPRPPHHAHSSAAPKLGLHSELEETPSLRRTLESLDHRLAELLKERTRVQSRLEQAASRLSPISRVPTEILMYIFELGAIPGPVAGVATIRETGGLFLDAVRRVCRTWREIAESTPSLWAYITIDIHNSLKNAELRLERSRCAPLDIQVSFTEHVAYTGNVTSALLAAFETLQPHMERWRSLRIEVPGHAHARAALRFCNGAAPRLKEFSLYVGAQKFTRNIRELSWMLEETSSLTTLSFSSVNFGWDAMVGPFSKLTSLYLSDYWFNSAPSCSQLLRLLGACAETLTDLTLRNMTEWDGEEDLGLLQHISYTPQVILPRLTRSVFYFCGSVRLSMLLSQLVLPSLKHLEIAYFDETSVPLEMLCFQKAGYLPIKSLTINCSVIVEDQLVQLLQRLPGLESLELEDCEDVSPFLLNELSDPETCLCPNLRLLSINGCTSVDSQAIRGLVGSRLADHQKLNRRKVAPIEELRISRCLQISPDTVQWLRMYVPVVQREF